MYRKVASMENSEDKMDIIDEFIDRFGDIPTEVVNLIDVTEIRNIAREFGFEDMSQKGDKLIITLTASSPVEALTKYICQNRLKAYMTSGKKINFIYSLEKVKSKNLCREIKTMLEEIKTLANEETEN
jgi:transcription-repair coupling factor (superfamily II helicase)